MELSLLWAPGGSGLPTGLPPRPGQSGLESAAGQPGRPPWSLGGGEAVFWASLRNSWLVSGSQRQENNPVRPVTSPRLLLKSLLPLPSPGIP